MWWVKTNARNHLQSLSWGQGFISQTIDCQYSRDPSPGSLGDAISDLHQPGSPGCKDDSSKSSLGCENVFLLCVLFAPLPKSFGVPKSFNPSIMCNDCKVLPSRNDKGLLHLCINIFLFRPNSGLISIDCYHY